MKLLRVCLLVLLATLLPLRGAMAAAMLCPPAGSGVQSGLHPMGHAAAGHTHDADAGSQPHQHHDGGPQEHGHDADGDAGSAHQDKCNLCSAFCSLTPLLSEVPRVIEPRDLADATFPSLSAPAPTSLQGRQERPPRSI